MGVTPIQQRLAHGQPVRLVPPPRYQGETPTERAARTIPATWLQNLAVGPTRIVRVPIFLENVIVAGPLDLRRVTLLFELVAVQCEISDACDFSFATFQRGVTFLDCEFNG